MISDEINKQPEKYWSLEMDISSKFTISRIQRCTQIMVRNDDEDLATSQMFYPCIQCADIFFYVLIFVHWVWIKAK